MTTVENSEQEVGVEKAVCSTLPEHTLDVDGTELSGSLVGRSPQSDNVLALIDS